MKKAVIIDYGVGNIRSLKRCVESSSQTIGTDVKVSLSKDVNEMNEADLLIIPGVGSWGAACEHLGVFSSDLRDLIKSGKPTFAVCLGMQLLFESSEEGVGKGLGVFEGDVTTLNAKQIPEMGWNKIAHANAQYEIIDWAYFAHSFAVRPKDDSIVAGMTTYEDDTFASILRTPSLLATQFHPEKSDVVGISLVHKFLKEVLS